MNRRLKRLIKFNFGLPLLLSPSICFSIFMMSPWKRNCYSLVLSVKFLYVPAVLGVSSVHHMCSVIPWKHLYVASRFLFLSGVIVQNSLLYMQMNYTALLPCFYKLYQLLRVYRVRQCKHIIAVMLQMYPAPNFNYMIDSWCIDHRHQHDLVVTCEH